MKILRTSEPVAGRPAPAPAPVPASAPPTDQQALKALEEKWSLMARAWNERFEQQAQMIQELNEIVQRLCLNPAKPPEAEAAPCPEEPADTPGISEPVQISEASPLWSRIWGYLNESSVSK
jgi:hypothetical protein